MSEETAQDDKDFSSASVEQGDLNESSEAPPASPKEETKKKKVSSSYDVPILNENVEIYADKPLEGYNVGDVKAFKAKALKRDLDCFALICEPHLVPRVKASESYGAFMNPSLPPLVERGKIFWPPANAERYVFVYRDILGNVMKSSGAAESFGWKQDHVLDVVVKPMVGVLQDFRDKDFVHGTINPGNMFDGGGGEQTQRVILGDCLSVPCSYTQPAAYETIERAMADPIGRGKAVAADDLYALGVSIAAFMRSSDPLKGLSPKQIVQRKIELGSYAAVTGKDRFKGSILELLRGLLLDDPAQRWTIDEVLIWLDGSRLSPKQAVRMKKAPRPLTFNETKHLYLPSLAMDLPNNPPELIRLIEGQDLEQWIGRAFEDEEAEERLENALREASVGGKGGAYQDRLVMTISSALDTMAPMRYKEIVSTADAFGNVMAYALINGQDIKAFIELMSGSLILNWISNSESPAVDKGVLAGRLESCRHYLKQSKVGYGVERCLYVLAPEVHCLSDKLQGYHVRSPEDMIFAFEDLCQKGKAPAFFIDRHSAAFLSVKDSKCIDSFLFDLGAGEEHKRVLGALKTLAVIQNRGSLPPMYALAKTFLDMLPCVYERYHDQSIRESLKKNIEKFAQAGDLIKMAGLLDNPDVTAKDLNAFKSAMVEYAQLRQEAKKLEKNLVNKEAFGRQTGKELAAIVSSIIAGIVILTMGFMFITGQSLF